MGLLVIQKPPPERGGVWRGLLPSSKQVADAVHVEADADAEGLVEWVAGVCGDDVASVDAHDVHAESRTYGEVAAAALVLALVVVASTQRELVVVSVFSTYAPVDEFELVAAREALEHTLDGAHVVVFLAYALLIYFVGLVGTLQRLHGHEELVGIGGEGDFVELVEGDGDVAAKTQVRGDEVGVVAAVVYLRAYVADVEAEAQQAFAIAQHYVVVPIQRHVGSECGAGLEVVVVVAAHVGVHVSEPYGRAERLAEHAAVRHIHRELVGAHGHVLVGRHSHVAERKVAHGAADGLIVAEAHVADGVQQGDAVGKLSQPRRVVDGHARTANGEGVFCGVPRLRVYVGVRCRTHVAKTAGTRVGSNALRRDCRHHGVEGVADIVVALREDRRCDEHGGD